MTDRWEAAKAEVERRVAEGRANGLYPEELDEQLASQFSRAAKDPLAFATFDELRERLEHLAGLSVAVRRDGMQSSVPGGEIVHRTIAKLTSRQMTAVDRDLTALLHECQGVLTAVAAALDEVRTVVSTDLFGDIDAIHHRLVTVEHRLARLEAAPSTATFDASTSS
jgi:hypothetical protein